MTDTQSAPDAPENAAAATADMRRRYERHDARSQALIVCLSCGSWAPVAGFVVFLENLSQGGIAFKTATPLEEGTSIIVRTGWPRDDAGHTLYAVVKHVRRDAGDWHRVGAQYCHPPADMDPDAIIRRVRALGFSESA